MLCFSPFPLSAEGLFMLRRKGDNAQQVIDLTAALKRTDLAVAEKSSKIEALEAEILVLKQDLKVRDAANFELEATNQLLKVSNAHTFYSQGLDSVYFSKDPDCTIEFKTTDQNPIFT